MFYFMKLCQLKQYMNIFRFKRKLKSFHRYHIVLHKYLTCITVPIGFSLKSIRSILMRIPPKLLSSTEAQWWG